MFSQHILYPPGSQTIGETEIWVNVTFKFSECTFNSDCTNDFVTLYRFDANRLEPKSERLDPSNYVPLFGPGTETTESRLQQESSSHINIKSLRSFLAPRSHTGFYLGIRDTSTCGKVSRIIIYYTPCHSYREGLVSYPEVIRPPEGSLFPNVAHACCAPHSHNTTSRSVRAYNDGRCDFSVKCECDKGHRLADTGTSCIRKCLFSTVFYVEYLMTF